MSESRLDMTDLFSLGLGLLGVKAAHHYWTHRVKTQAADAKSSNTVTFIKNETSQVVSSPKITIQNALKAKPALIPAPLVVDEKKLDDSKHSLSRLNSSHYLANTFSFKEIKSVKNLGSGTYGDVMLAKYKDQNVAIKRFKDIFELFHESKNVCDIDSKYVVKPLGCHFNPPALMLEYLPNGMLENVLLAKNLSFQQRLQLALDVANGIADMHKKNYSHRDITVRNVICYTDEHNRIRAKLVDLGMSAFANEHSYWGCALYISPEAIMEITKFDPKAVDIYSLGVIFTEIMSTLLSKLDMQFLEYYDEDNRQVAGKNKADGLFEDLVEFNLESLKQKGQMTDEMADLILSCIQVDPAARPSISQVIQVLELLLGAFPSPAAKPVTDNSHSMFAPINEIAYYWIEHQLKVPQAVCGAMTVEDFVNENCSKSVKPSDLQSISDKDLIFSACFAFSKKNLHSSALFFREYRSRKIKAAAQSSEGNLPLDILALVDGYEHKEIKFRETAVSSPAQKK